VQACISVWRQFDYLFSPGGAVGGQPQRSDTGAIADVLLLPYWFWGAAISVAILGLLWWSFRLAFRRCNMGENSLSAHSHPIRPKLHRQLQIAGGAESKIRISTAAPRCTAQKRGPVETGPLKVFRRGCLKGRVFFALANNLCKCEERIHDCEICNQKRAEIRRMRREGMMCTAQIGPVFMGFSQ
jgi:hypothetical protein